MFADACKTILNSLYAIVGMTDLGNNEVNVATGSAFMVAPGILATAAHLLHTKKKPGQPLHEAIYAIHAPGIGHGACERPTLVAEDRIRDLALLRVKGIASISIASLEPDRVPVGTPSGFLGFPFSKMITIEQPELIVRFQAGHVSAFTTITPHQGGVALPFYEIDRLMYPGASGCPNFLANGKVIGMHAKSAHETDDESPRIPMALTVPAPDILAFLERNKIRV